MDLTLLGQEIHQRVLSEPSAEKRFAKCGAVLQHMKDSGTFSITEVLLCPEPIRSMVFSICDGVFLDGGVRPLYNQSPLIEDDPELLLVHVNPRGTMRKVVVNEGTKETILKPDSLIMGQEWALERVLGSYATKRVKVPKVYGDSMAWVDNTFPNRQARQILHRDGFGWRQAATGLSRSGSVIEWRWLDNLVKRAKSDHLPLPFGCAELHANILERPGFREFARIVDPADAKRAKA
jgi:hypothetical protein